MVKKRTQRKLEDKLSINEETEIFIAMRNEGNNY